MNKHLSHLHDAVSRILLIPSLRLMRDRFDAHPDYRDMRLWAKKVDAILGSEIGDARTETVPLGECTMTWLDVQGARRDHVVLYLHGGAFIMETPALHMALLARLCRATHARGLMVNYRLAPEHTYPTAHDECHAAYLHLLDAGYAPGNIVIAGDSAGGNFALSTLLRVRDSGLPLPCAALALSPLTDGTMTGDSIQRNEGHDPMFTAAMFRAIGPLYLPNAALRIHPYVSPLLGDLAGLPPILLMAGSSELLLDDSVRFEAKCPSATLIVWHDVPHVFPIFPFLHEADDAVRRMAAFVQAHFGGGPAARLADATAAAERSRAPSKARASIIGDHANAEWAAAHDPAPTRRAHDPAPPRRTIHIPALATVYLLFALAAALTAIAGLLIPSGIPGVTLPGVLAMPRFGPIPGVDALIAAVATLVFIGVDGVRRGITRLWLPAAATLLFGVACGLPFYLYMSERQARIPAK